MKYLNLSVMILLLSGCATTAVYDPLRAATQQVLLLNESSLKNIKEGMTQDNVHDVMGQEIVIGYTKQSAGYKPLTIPNPYKVEQVETLQGTYTVEYYVRIVRQPDGVITDDELMPLVFKDSKLIGRDWSFVKSIRPAQPSA